MKHIEELNALLESKEKEKESIRSQIRSLQDQKAKDEKVKKESLAKGDNDAYLAAHRRIYDCDIQIQGLQDLLADKENNSDKAEIVKAVNNAINDFNADRKKAAKKYQDAKRALAQMYAEACHEENIMSKIRLDYMNQADMFRKSGEIKSVKSIEPMHQEAIRFFKNDLIALGYDLAAILTGREQF